jgi:hypothetical protein
VLVFGESFNRPCYDRKLSENIPDSEIVKNLLTDLSVLGFSEVGGKSLDLNRHSS